MVRGDADLRPVVVPRFTEPLPVPLAQVAGPLGHGPAFTNRALPGVAPTLGDHLVCRAHRRRDRLPGRVDVVFGPAVLARHLDVEVDTTDGDRERLVVDLAPTHLDTAL